MISRRGNKVRKKQLRQGEGARNDRGVEKMRTEKARKENKKVEW